MPPTTRATSTTTLRQSASNSTTDADAAPHTAIEQGTKPKIAAVDDRRPTIDWLYAPRNVSMLVTIVGFLLYVALFRTAANDAATNTKMGLAAALTIFVIIGTVAFADGPFIRPHPVFWRAILSVSVFYQLILTFVLFQNKEDARFMLKFVDKRLGVPLPERSYAECCTVTWETVRSKMDIFVIAHVIGWYGKALLFRDYWLCWIISVLFEVAEYSLEHQLPNFAECWWDHWVLDVLLCNAIGIHLGMITCRYLRMKSYCWRGVRQLAGCGAKLKRSLQQFTPHSWTPFEWAPGRSLRNYVAVLVIVATVLQCELNCFYLKFLLWVPPEHSLNVVRVLLIGCMAAPAVREYYDFVFDADCRKLGTHALLLFANVSTETLICAKFGRGEFDAAVAPHAVKCFWAVFLAVLAVYPLVKFWLLKAHWPRSNVRPLKRE